MPRPILMNPQKSQVQTGSILEINHKVQKKQNLQMNKMQMDRLLRKKRSKEYMNAIKSLDAGGHVHNQNKVNEIINSIKDEFPEVEIAGILLGIVSLCYLGRPYEVHTLDIAGSIIQHYKSGERLPDGLECARNIAMRGGYEFIEVYSDCCRAVSADGAVAVIPN